MYVICKKCGKQFTVMPPSDELNLGRNNIDLGGGSIDVNKITFGTGGGISLGPGSSINFKKPSSPRYKCPSCGHEDEYQSDEIF